MSLPARRVLDSEPARSIRQASDAEAAVRDPDRQLQLISENFPAGAVYQYVVTADGQRRLTYVGPGFLQIFGEEPAQLPVDIAWLSARIHSADEPGMAEAGIRSQRDLTPFYHEVRIRRADGEERWVSFRSRPRALADRSVVWDGAIIDVTERRHAEEAGRRQVEFLAALNQTTLDLLGRRSGAELLQALVDRAALLLKSPHAEISLLEGDTLVMRAFSKGREYLAGDRVGRNEPAISWRAIDTRTPVVTDNYSARPDGREVYRERGIKIAAVFPIVRGRECDGVLGLAREATGEPFSATDVQEGSLLAQMAALVLHNAVIYEEAVRAAEARTIALRESEERFRCVFDRSPIAISLLSMPHGRIVDLNPAALAAFGYPRDEVVGRTSLDLNLWVDPARHDDYFEELRTAGTIRRFEAEMRCKDGRTFTALHDGSLVTIGGQSYSLNSVQDISAHKQSEAARDCSLALMRATLESTADAILVVNSRGRIETYNRNFAAMWRLNGEAAEDPDETRLLRSILDQLVAPEKFLAGAGDRDSRPEHQVCDELECKDGRVIERHCRPQILRDRPVGQVWSFRDITKRRRAEEEQMRVAAQTRQSRKLAALGALAGGIAHDFEHMLNGTDGLVDLARRELPPGHSVHAWLDRIAASSEHGRELVNQILTFSRRYDGDITVRSAVGEGTTSEVSFPAVVGERAPPAPMAPCLPRGHGERILVVDDDAVSGFVLEKTVTSLGYAVTRCSRPEEALARFTAAPSAFDLVVTDLAMPGMSGEELIEELVRIRPDLPIVVASGYVGTVPERILKRGAARAVLRKPVARDELARALAQNLQR